MQYSELRTAYGEDYILAVHHHLLKHVDPALKLRVHALSDDDFVSFMSQILFSITSCQRGNRYAVVLIPIIGQRMAHEVVEMFELYSFVN